MAWSGICTLLLIALFVGFCYATSPMYRQEQNSLDFEVIRNKESIPHNAASKMRLYIKLKPTIVNNNNYSAPTCANAVYIPPPPEFTFWDWLFTNNALLLGTLDFFSYIGLKQEEETIVLPSCPQVPPTPTLRNIQLKIQLLQQNSTLTRARYSMSQLNTVYPTLQKMEIDPTTKLTTYTLTVASITSDSHVIVDLTIPASEMQTVNVAKISIACTQAETTEREEIVSIRRNAPTMDSILPISIQYSQNTSVVPMAQEQQISVAYQFSRLPSQEEIIEGIELNFEKYSTHTIYTTALPMIRIGNAVTVKLSPWIVNSVKRVGFRFKVPPTRQSGTQLLMKNVRLHYTLKKQHFRYAMEMELLDNSIERQ